MRWTLAIALLLSAPLGLAAEETITLEEATREQCLAILRAGVNSEEFWPAMHAAEGLTQAGCPDEARKALSPRLPVEVDDQRRCGLARELVRAGDLTHTQIMLDILAGENSYGHTHAAESLYKVWQIGDGVVLRRALARFDHPKTGLMAAAALARWGNPEALKVIRAHLSDADGETAKVAAWILARIGDASDIPKLREGATRFSEPLTKAYFEHALACLGDKEGRTALLLNLKHPDTAVRTYACEFAPEARVVEAKDSLIALLKDTGLDVRIRAAQALLVLAKPRGPDRREGFARDIFKATKKNPRYSEGSVVGLRDGRLLYATTELTEVDSDLTNKRIVAAISCDDGRSWSQPQELQRMMDLEADSASWTPAPDWQVKVPMPESTVYVIPSTGDWLLVGNSKNDSKLNPGGPATTLSTAISNDQGRTWSRPRQIESNPKSAYGDASVFFHQGRILLTYPVRDEKTGRISSRFRSLPIGDLYQ